MSVNIPANLEQATHTKYRADIDGLRAIAVLAVVGFHAFPIMFEGGFIGVDIFFVISGFLISTIIFSKLEQSSFSFIEFYSRRIKRIFPSLLVVLIASYAIGWFILTSGEYAQLGKHIASGAGFISNIMLWRESGYFDSAANSKPLLHLWSLGVEEQYYIIWPLLLWIAWKNKLNLLSVTIFFFLASFVLNIITVQNDLSAAFYLPQVRFWELLVGSSLAYGMLHKQNIFAMIKRYIVIPKENHGIIGTAISLLGAALITLGFFVINEELLFPGWWALLPTLGAMLIISAGPQAWLNRAVLSKPIMVWFGLISYPLYLWHWPLLTFLNILEIDTPSFVVVISVVLLSILLSWLTYLFIEKPVRLGGKSNPLVFSLLIMMAFVGTSGYISYKNNGFQGSGYRIVEKSEFENYFENSLPNWNYFEREGIMTKFRFDCDFYDIPNHRQGKPTSVPAPFSSIDKSCYTRDPEKKKVLLIWGDSHMQMQYYGLKNNLPDDWQILIGTSSGCQPNPYVVEDSETDYCLRSNWFTLKTIKETKPDVVIVAQELGLTIQKINDMSNILFESGVDRVIINGPAPHWKENLPNIILRELWDNTPERTLLGIREDVMDSNSELRTQFPQKENLLYADLIGVFCEENGCLTRIGGNKMTGITTWDIGHMTPIASDYLAKKLFVNLVINGN